MTIGDEIVATAGPPVARTIMAPDDMPIGIVTGLVGGVAFVMLLRRR